MYSLSFCMAVVFALGVLMLQIHSPFTRCCRDDERNSLLDFKGGFIDLNGRLSSWQGYNGCQWKEVTCDPHTSHVIGLHLKNPHPSNKKGYRIEGKPLRGEIHPSLFNLQHLQHLDLSYNDFNGAAIPPGLTNLTRLSFLSLSNAGFEGEIPVELGNLSTLGHLDLSNSELRSRSFTVWIRNLRSLEYLAMERVNLSTASEHWGEALSSLSNLKEVHLSSCGLSGTIPSLVNLTHLSDLHLSFNSFPFPMPAWFQNVSSLVSLDLSACYIYGSIPSNFLHHSSSLSVLSLHSNSLQGAIPPFIANFSKLQKLNLAGTQLTGEIPSFVSRLSSLEYLELSNNRLNGHIPSSLGDLSLLRDLRLGSNMLSGTIPDTLLKLPKLETLFLNSNPLNGSVSLSMFENLTLLHRLDLSQLTVKISSSWVPQFEHLRCLGLRACNIEGEFPAFLSIQYSLIEVDISDNNIVGNIPTWLWDLPYLSIVNVSNNQLEGSLPLRIENEHLWVVDLHQNRLHGSLPAIDFATVILDMSENKFNGSIPATFVVPSSFLSLSGNNLGGEIPHTICTDENSLLQILDLSNNSLNGVIPTNLGRCSHLTVLNLAQNDLESQIPEELGNLTRLQTLNLNGNNLHGIVPSSISNCTDLQVLDIGNNNFQGSIPAWIVKLTRLKILSLTFNQLQGSIPTQLMSLQNLQILDLSHNKLSGIIPGNLLKLNAMVNESQSIEIQSSATGSFAIENLWIEYKSIYVDQVTVWIKGRAISYPKIIRAFRFIDLSHNKLSGNIPPEMGLLKGLISLNLSENNLMGSIPDTLGGMAHLESLDLSRNKLSGKIPLELVNLTFLSALNLSDNMISGLIPRAKKFSTFDASSFLGNRNLHGPQLDNKTVNSGLGERGKQDELNKREEEDPWWAVGVGLSYGVGFATVVGVLCFHIIWRNKYFAFLDSLLTHLFEQ